MADEETTRDAQTGEFSLSPEEDYESELPAPMKTTEHPLDKAQGLLEELAEQTAMIRCVLRPDSTAKLPERANPTDAGLDFFTMKAQTIPAGKRVLIETGVSVAVPKGHALLLKDKSGLAAQHGLTVLAGVIDADYRGEIKIIVLNTDIRAFTIEAGKKIAQGVLVPILTPLPIQVDSLDDTPRGSGGFGSSGS